MNLLINLKTIILDTYIIIPFVVALMFGALSALKNPIYLRRSAILFSFIQFALASALYLGFGETNFSFLNISFCYDKFSSLFVFIVSFIFFLISVLSKTFIFKMQKAFWTVLFLILGLINVILLSNNILIYFLGLIWLIFLGYFLNITFCTSKNYKKDINSQLKLDVGIVAVSVALILFDFLRYFVLNDIEFCFSNIAKNLYHINSTSVELAFLGFFILNLKLFNIIPFACKNIENSTKINPLVAYINLFIQLIAGSFIFFKVDSIFAYLYWDYQEIIICYLVFNLIYYMILALRFDSIYKFLNSIAVVSFIMPLLSIFVFGEKGLSIYTYSSVATIISFSLLYFMIAILSNKFKTDKFDEFKKIPPKNRKTILFTIFSLLNFAGVPILSMFSARLCMLSSVFGINFEGIIPSIVPYAILFGCFYLSLVSFKVFNCILVAPVDFQKKVSELSRHHIFVLSLLSLCVLILGLCSNQIVSGLIFTT